jgi:hypothetical protein
MIDPPKIVPSPARTFSADIPATHEPTFGCNRQVSSLDGGLQYRYGGNREGNEPMNKFTLALVATSIAPCAHAEGTRAPNHQLQRFLHGTKYVENFNQTVKIDNTNYYTQIAIGNATETR